MFYEVIKYQLKLCASFRFILLHYSERGRNDPGRQKLPHEKRMAAPLHKITLPASVLYPDTG